MYFLLFFFTQVILFIQRDIIVKAYETYNTKKISYKSIDNKVEKEEKEEKEEQEETIKNQKSKPLKSKNE